MCGIISRMPIPIVNIFMISNIFLHRIKFQTAIVRNCQEDYTFYITNIRHKIQNIYLSIYGMKDLFTFFGGYSGIRTNY